MEIKSELLKPHSEKQRIDFIIEQNHKKGYEIRETDKALQAWGYTAEEIAQQEQDRINNLSMTALDFIKALQSFGLTLEQINAYLETNLAAKMQLTYCQNVYYGIVKALMPVTVGDINITADIIEKAFKVKNSADSVGGA